MLSGDTKIALRTYNVSEASSNMSTIIDSKAMCHHCKVENPTLITLFEWISVPVFQEGLVLLIMFLR